MIYTDEELSEIEGYDEDDEESAAPMVAAHGSSGAPMQAPGAIPLYPLSLAHLGQQPSPAAGMLGFVKKKVGPLPVWAWAALGVGVAGGGWYFLSRRKKSEDSGEEGSASLSQNDSGGDSAPAGWSPSRSSFAAQLQRFFDKKGLTQAVVVWHDAEDAQRKGKLKFVSPLINVQVKDKSVKVDAALQKFCRREGLNPTQHDDGSIGLYPHTGKRGKAWEDYVDALRDDGQQV